MSPNSNFEERKPPVPTVQMLKRQFNQAKIKSIISDEPADMFSVNLSKKSNHHHSSLVLSAVNENNDQEPFSCGSLNELIALT